jgi:hypothetical protein
MKACTCIESGGCIAPFSQVEKFKKKKHDTVPIAAKTRFMGAISLFLNKTRYLH